MVKLPETPVVAVVALAADAPAPAKAPTPTPIPVIGVDPIELNIITVGAEDAVSV